MYDYVIAEGNDCRLRYAEGMDALVKRLNAEGKERRAAFMPAEQFPQHAEEYRQKYKQMLGLDLLSDENCPSPCLTRLGSDAEKEIYRLITYVTPELPMYGLLFVPYGAERAPLVVAQHGGGGTPELCSDLHGANNYGGMVRRCLARGAVVLAPQLLLWNFKEEMERQRKYPHAYARIRLDNELKRFGLSMTGVEIGGIMKAITYLTTLPFVDGERIGMLGISYGGYYTLHTAAADPRIKAAYAMSCFNDRDVYSWQDFCYKNSGYTFQDAEVAALCAPRKLFVSLGKNDLVFDYSRALDEGERVRKYFDAFGCPQNYVFDLWDGGHTIRDDDLGLDFLFSAL